MTNDPSASRYRSPMRPPEPSPNYQRRNRPRRPQSKGFGFVEMTDDGPGRNLPARTSREQQPRERVPVDQPLSPRARWTFVSIISAFAVVCILIAIFMPQFKALIHH